MTTMRYFLATLALLAATASADVVVRDHADQAIVRYDRSYALLIGVSDYTAGWRDLTSIPGELEQVEEVLLEHGFEITKVLDPTERELRDAFESFIDSYGYVASHRLLVFYAGHGYSRPLATGVRGYLVPADAPRPTTDLGGFLGKAVPMDDVGNWARRIEALHALFVFDSCFSGTIFDARSELPRPTAVTSKMGQRVRQFIAAGSADEEVPGRSQFTPAFVEALRGAADLVRDGYVTGTELGIYLDQKAQLPQQTPQFGRLPGYHQGDFVFRLDIAPAPEIDVDFSDLRELSELQASWTAYQLRMQSTFEEVSEVEGLGGTREIKLEAWRRFLDAFEEENPYSEQDDELRTRALRRLDALLGDEDDLQNPGTSPVTNRPGDVWVEKQTGMRFRYIPSGTFLMGSPPHEEGRDSDETQREVTLTRGYWIGETEVTQGQWRALMGNNPSYFKACGDDCPVEQVSWFEAIAFANALSERAGRTPCYRVSGSNGKKAGEGLEYESVEAAPSCDGFRLPTEAEWERAARAGTNQALYTGDLTIDGERNGPQLDSIAWYGGNSGVGYSGVSDCSDWPERQRAATTCGTHPVGQKRPNDWGLYDPLGNVFEWTGDWYSAEPKGNVDPSGPEDGSDRVLRGGSWYSLARGVRAAYRDWHHPGGRGWFYGFRLSSGP